MSDTQKSQTMRDLAMRKPREQQLKEAKRMLKGRGNSWIVVNGKRKWITK